MFPPSLPAQWRAWHNLCQGVFSILNSGRIWVKELYVARGREAAQGYNSIGDAAYNPIWRLCPCLLFGLSHILCPIEIRALWPSSQQGPLFCKAGPAGCDFPGLRRLLGQEAAGPDGGFPSARGSKLGNRPDFPLWMCLVGKLVLNRSQCGPLCPSRHPSLPLVFHRQPDFCLEPIRSRF